MTLRPTSIFVMCGGPPKPGRNRHLERFRTRWFGPRRPLIDIVLDACTGHPATDVHLVHCAENTALCKHVARRGDKVRLLQAKSELMLDSFRAAFEAGEHDALVVSGDLRRLRRDHVALALACPHDSALCRFSKRWGPDIRSVDGSLVMRSDFGSPLFRLAHRHKERFLSPVMQAKAYDLFRRFYPHREFDPRLGVHYWGWLIYAFFEVFSGAHGEPPERAPDGLGYIRYKTPIWDDND